jgi:ferredoxin
MPIRVTVDLAKCQAYRRCIAVAPAIFGIGADGKAEVLHSADAPAETVLKGVRSCPYRAITAINEATGEQLFPPPRQSNSPQT